MFQFNRGFGLVHVDIILKTTYDKLRNAFIHSYQQNYLFAIMTSRKLFTFSVTFKQITTSEQQFYYVEKNLRSLNAIGHLIQQQSRALATVYNISIVRKECEPRNPVAA